MKTSRTLSSCVTPNYVEGTENLTLLGLPGFRIVSWHVSSSRRPPKLMVVISAPGLPEDLYASVRSSPAVYECFQPSRHAIVLSVTSQEFGDAAHICKALLHMKDNNGYKFEVAVERYGQVLSQGMIATRGPAIDEVFDIIRLNHTV